jgi:hypothetical protein
MGGKNQAIYKIKCIYIMAQVPNPPFFFRIFSPNGQGIVYRADRDNGDSYMCTGSRQIGQVGSAIIWEVGGYADAMPRESMHTIMGRPKPLSKAQTNAFVDANGLAAKYKQMCLYSDGGYWFAEKGRSRSRSRNSSGSRNGSRGRAARSKSRPRETKRSKSKGKK